MSKSIRELLEEIDGMQFPFRIEKGIYETILTKEQTGTIRQNINQALALRAKPCEWKWNEELYEFTTSCKETFSMTHWLRERIRTTFRTCPFCGQPIKEITE